jgi:hypothetical protein
MADDERAAAESHSVEPSTPTW